MTGFATGEEAPAPRPPSVLGFFVAACLLLLALLLFARWIVTERARAEEARAMVRLSYEKRLALADLLLGLGAVEGVKHEFIITGQPVFLRSYAPAHDALDRELALLERQFAAEPRQLARLQRLSALIAARSTEIDQALHQRAVGGTKAALAVFAADDGRPLMAQARAVTHAAVADETATLTRDIAQANARAASAKNALWLLLACAGVLLAVALLALWRNRVRHYRLEMEAREALTRLRAVFAGTAEALLILSPDGAIEDANPAAERLLGYTPRELDGRHVLDLAPGKGAFADRLGIVDARLVRPIRQEMVAAGNNGRELPVDVALGLMPLADGVHLVVSLRDITERKAAERLKSDFISTVSHELRTPLTSVVGSLGLLRGGSAGELPGTARRLVEIAENNAQRLIRLINDILDIDRIGSGQVRIEPARVDLGELARRGIADAQGLAEARGITLALDRVDEPLPVVADADRILQVIGNLLSNAIRFSPEGGAVHAATLRRDGMGVVCIADAGPGIAPEFRERIFSRFAQSSAGAAIPGGSGLGLAISREIVKAHEGEIWFDDAVQGGTRFCVALPLHLGSTQASAVATPTILLCEDDADAAEVLRAILEEKGYRVEQCGSARAVQALAQSGDYAAVVLDLRLPDASGLAALRGLRATPKTRGLPVIVVSAFARDNRREPAAGALDVIDWIDKPVAPVRLLGAIEAAIRRSTEGRPTLLHVDDDADMLEVTALGLAEHGRVLKATSLADARAILAEATPDIVILDLALPDGSGLDLLPDLFAADGSAIPTIIYSAAEIVPEMDRQFDAVLVKSRGSMVVLSEAIGRALTRRQEDRGLP